MFLYPMNYREVVVVPTLVAAAYSSGDVIGVGAAPIALTNVAAQDDRPAALVKVSVVDLSHSNSILNLYLFNRRPTAVAADNAAYAPSAADMKYLIGIVNIPAGTAFATPSVQVKLPDPPLPFKTKAGSNRTIWLVIVSGGTPTYGTVADLTLTFLFEHKV